MAGWSLGIAVGIHIFIATGSPAATSGLLVASTVPAIAFGSLGGVAADRFRRDRLLKIISWVRMITVAALLLVGNHPIGLYVVTFAQSTQMQFFTPAEQATVASVVGDQDLPAAMSANSIAGNATRLAGPALGGLLVTTAGFPATVIAVCASLTVAAILLGFLPKGSSTTAVKPAAVRDWIEGLRVTAMRPHARSVAVFQILDSIKEGPLTSLFPVLMLGVVGSSAAYMGVVNSSFAVTAILGAPLVSVVTQRLGYRWPIAAGATISSGLLLLLAAWPSEPSALAVFALSGFPFTISWVAANTWLLTNTEDRHRGRVTGTISTLNAAATAAFAAIAGAAAETLPVSTVLTGAAVIEALAGPTFLIMTRRLTKSPTERAGA